MQETESVSYVEEFFHEHSFLKNINVQKQRRSQTMTQKDGNQFACEWKIFIETPMM